MSKRLLGLIAKIYEIVLKQLQVGWYGAGNNAQEIWILL